MMGYTVKLSANGGYNFFEKSFDFINKSIDIKIKLRYFSKIDIF